MVKDKLRKKILKLRKIAHKKDKSVNFNKIYKFLKSKKLLKKSIGGYFPVNNEIDDLNILKCFSDKKYEISLPVIKKNFNMDFYKWSFEDPLKINKYGIAEPISVKKIYPDIIFVPLVAYDDDLNRLGYGGGFYDRYLEKIANTKKILKIGLGFSYQELNKIPINKYDKKLDLIITEKKIIQ